MSSLDRLSDFLVQLDKNEEQAAAAQAPAAEAPASPLDALADFVARLDVETAPGAAPGSAPGEQDLTAAAAKMYENEVVLPEAVGFIPREIERGGRLTVEQAAAAIATPGIRGQLIQSIYNGAWTLAEFASAGMGPAMREIRTQSPELKEAITGAAAQETSMAIERAAFDTQMDPTRVREELIAAQGAAQGISKGQREGIVGDIARATGQSLTQFAAMAPAVVLGTPVAGAALASQLYLPGSSYTAGALEYIDQMNRDRAEAAMEGRDLPEFTLSGMRDYAATSALINTGVEMGGAAIGGKIIGKIAKGATASKIGQAALKPLIDRGMPIVDRAMVSKVGSKGLQTFARLSENTLEFRNGFFGKALAMGATSGLEEGGEELVTAALMAPFTSAPLSEDIANGLYSSMIGVAAGGVGGTAPIGAFAVRQGIVNRVDAMRAETDRERVLRQIHSEALQRKTNWTKDLTEEQNARLSTALDSVNGMDQEQRGTFLRELADRRVDVRSNVDNLLTQRQQLDIGLTGARDLAENGTDEEKAAAKDQEAQILGQIETLDEQLRLASSDAMMADAQYAAVAEKIGEMPATIDQAQPEQVLTDVSTRAGVELKPVAMPKNGRRAQAQVEALGRKVVWFRPSAGTFSPAFHSMRSRGVVYMNADAPPTNVLANALEEVFHDIQMFQPELAQVFMDKAGLMPVYQAGVAYAAQGTKESAGKAQLDKAAIAQAESAVSELAGEGATVSPEVARAGAARIEQEGTANAFAAAARATGSGSILAPLQQFAARRGFLGRDVMAAMAVLDAASRAAAVETVEGTKPVATLSPLARTLLWANDMNLDFKGELDAAESFARRTEVTQPKQTNRAESISQTTPATVPSEARPQGVSNDQPTQPTEPAARDRGGVGEVRSLAPLEGAPRVSGATGPDPNLVAVAERYARDNGIPLRRQAAYAKVDEDRASRIAAAYDEMKHAPNDPVVREAYENLIQQTLAQYRALEQDGYQFYFYDETTDPYDGKPWNAMRDLRANKRMAVFTSLAGFGTEPTDVSDNPLLAETGLFWSYGTPDGPRKRVLANDLFRAVHDAFGHGLEGAGFRADGEENAWQAHVRLFTGSAVAALTSETRGQNSWLNFGPYGEKNRTAAVEDTTFATQKSGLMPEWTWTEGRVADASDISYARPSDTEYLAAVERGDMEAAQRMVDLAARLTGYTNKAYHGSASKPFWVFDPARRGERTGSNSALLGFFASTEKQVAREYQLTETERRQYNEPSDDGLTLGGGLQSAEFALERAFDIETSAIEDSEQGGWLAQLTAIDQFGSQYTYDDGFVYDTRAEAENAAENEKTKEIAKHQSRVDAALQRFQDEERELRAGRTLHDLWVRLDNPLEYDFAGGTFRDKSYSELVQEAIDEGHDGVIMRNTRDAIDSDTVSDVIVFFKSNQAKLADPVTYDEQGNIVPLSQRFDTSRAEISYARPSDTDYLAAVERGDMATAQRMVDEAAKAAGYQYVGYHASMQDFTEFLSLIEQAEARGEEFDYEGYEGGNLGRGFYFTPDLTYAKRFGKPRKFYLKIENIVDSRNESVKDRLRQIYADIVDDQGGAQQGEAYDALMDETNADGVIAEDAGGFAYGATELLVKRSNQAKLADPVTYDEQGNIVPLSQRFDASRDDISYARPAEDPEVTALRQQIEDLTRQMRDVQNTTAAQRVNALREVRVLERKLSAAQLLAQQKVGQAARSAARLEIQKQVNRDAKQAAEEAAATMSKDLESARATVASLRQQLREAKSNADTEDLLREAEKKLDRVANWSYAIGRNEGLVAGQVAGMQQERREQLRVIKPLKERLPLVEARLAKATEDLRAARKQIAQDERSAQKAVDFAYQLGLRSGQVQGMMRGRQVLLRKMAQREDTLQRQLTGLRDLMATKVTNLESLRAAISQIATDAARTLPVRLRGPLAVRIANAKTLGQANRIAVEATKLAINEEVSSTLKTIARLKKQMNKRGMKYDTRVQIETLLRDADAALRQANRRRIYASVGVMKNAAGKSMGAAILNAVNVYSQVADAAAKVDAALVLYTNDAAAFKAEKQARVAKYQADTAALVANMQGRPTLPMRDRTDQPVRTSLARRIRVANSDIYTLQLELEGKSDGIINKLLTAAQQGKGASALEHAAIIRQLEPLLQAAGYTGLDDYALKNGMLGQTIVNPVTVTLGGRNVTIPVGTMLSIAAMDDETLNVFPKAGEPLTQGIRFPGSRTTTTIYPTREEIIALKASLTPGQQAFIDGMKSILETQIRDRTMDAIWKIEGDQPPIVQNYWPRIRDMAGFEGESAGVLNQAGALVRGALTSVGFANARTGGNRPFLYSDAFQTWDRHIQVALDMIHMAQPYRDAATVLSDQNVVELIDRQMGAGTANAVLSIFSNGVGATARTNATIIDKLTNNVTGAVLSLSPRTWAKVQTGGIIRLASEVGPVYLAEGTAKTTAMLRSPQMWQARVEQVHSQSGYFTHRHQMNMRSIMSGTMSEQDRIKVMTAAKAVYKSIAAATDSSRAANFTDTLNSLGNAQDNANIVLSSLVDVLRAIDENIMLTAVEARLAEAKDQGYVGAAAFTVAVERAEQDFRRSQNSSDEFDETAFAAETRTSNKSPAWRMLFPFSSDTLKARNQIRRAWLSGERRAGTALAIGGNLTTNAVINAASVMTLLYIAKTISSVLGGADEPTDEEDKAFDKAVKELPVNVASELTGQVGGYVGIALQGVITAAMYRRAPMQALVTRPLEQATREVGKISGEDGSWAYLAPAILAVAQLRGVPAYQLYAFVAKQIPEAEKTPKEKLQKRLESIQERFSPEEIRKRVLQRAKNAGRVSIPLP